MSPLKCPDNEKLFEFISIPGEISLFRWMGLRLHTFGCKSCQKQMATLQSTWRAYFTPEPDITSSLMRVYSRLEKDETLILRGWKLGNHRSRRDLSSLLFSGGWLFRGAVSLGMAAAILIVVVSQMETEKPPEMSPFLSAPVAEIRFEDAEKTKVRYVRPQLLQSVEFETTSGR